MKQRTGKLAGRTAASEAKALWVAAVLRRQIRGYITGSQLPGRDELAAHFGVPLRVARRAVELLSREGLVECRPRGGAFVTAGQPRDTSMRRIVAITGPSPSAVHHAMVLGAERQCAHHRLGFLSLPNAPDVNQPDCLAQAAGGDPSHLGWVFVNLLPPDPTLLAWRLQAIPLVLAGNLSSSPGQPAHTVNSDSPGAIYRATWMLLNLGHRRIAYADAVESQEPAPAGRLLAFRLAHRRHGVELDESLLWEVGFTPAWDNRRVLLGELRQPGPPTAVVTATQPVGCDVLAVCHELGLAVPSRVSVISGGLRRRDLPALAGRLSCFDEGEPEELGRLAVDLLAQAHQAPGPAHVLAACKWVDRVSQRALTAESLG